MILAKKYLVNPRTALGILQLRHQKLCIHHTLCCEKLQVVQNYMHSVRLKLKIRLHFWRAKTCRKCDAEGRVKEFFAEFGPKLSFTQLHHLTWWAGVFL